jgi:hypothetical protein
VAEIKKALRQPLPQRVYGNLIYWLSILAAIVCIIAPVIAIAFPSKNVMNPHYLFFTIWEGKTPEAMWQEVGEGFPGGHFWLNNMTAGDGLMQFGLVLGCLSAGIALAATAVTFLLHKPRSRGWALLSVLVMVMIILAAIGIYHF